MPLGNHPKKYYSELHVLTISDSSSTIKLLFIFLDCVFVCMRRRPRCERREPVDEQYYEQANEDQFRDPEPEGQDLPEGYEDGKFNPIL